MTAAPMHEPGCTYCLTPDPDVCVRVVQTATGPRIELAHEQCALDRQADVLYRLLPAKVAS